MVYHNVNKKINHTFNYGLIYYMGNYTQFFNTRLNSGSIGFPYKLLDRNIHNSNDNIVH